MKDTNCTLIESRSQTVPCTCSCNCELSNMTLPTRNTNQGRMWSLNLRTGIIVVHGRDSAEKAKTRPIDMSLLLNAYQMKARRAPNKHISTGSPPITPYQFSILIPHKEVPFLRVPLPSTFDIRSVCSSQRLVLPLCS